jgi:hypothetical protein
MLVRVAAAQLARHWIWIFRIVPIIAPRSRVYHTLLVGACLGCSRFSARSGDTRQTPSREMIADIHKCDPHQSTTGS